MVAIEHEGIKHLRAGYFVFEYGGEWKTAVR